MTELTRLEKLVNVAVEREAELQEVSVKFEKLADFLGDDIFVVSDAYMFSLERRLDGYASVMSCLEFEIDELDVQIEDEEIKLLDAKDKRDAEKLEQELIEQQIEDFNARFVTACDKIDAEKAKLAEDKKFEELKAEFLASLDETVLEIDTKGLAKKIAETVEKSDSDANPSKVYIIEYV